MRSLASPRQGRQRTSKMEAAESCLSGQQSNEPNAPHAFDDEPKTANPNTPSNGMRRTWAGHRAWDDVVAASEMQQQNSKHDSRNRKKKHGFWKQRHRTWHGPGHWFHHHHHHHNNNNKKDTSQDLMDNPANSSQQPTPSSNNTNNLTESASTTVDTTNLGQQHHHHHHHHMGCSAKAFAAPAHALSKFWHAIEDFLFPKSRLLGINNNKNSSTSSSAAAAADTKTKLRPGMVLLEGCETLKEHYDKIKQVCCAIQDLHGKEGLQALGMEYRWVLCDEHKPPPEDVPEEVEDDVIDEDDLDNSSDNEEADSDSDVALPLSALPSHLLPDGTPNLTGTDITSTIRSTDTMFTVNTSRADPLTNNTTIPPNTAISHECGNFCHWCSRRLFYQNQMIDQENRKRFIADGDMYEQVARLCQEYAHEIMCQEANLQWVTVEETPDRAEPLRVLVSANHPMLQNDDNNNAHDNSTRMDNDDSKNQNRPTLLICTGRGKVRAGIFSRKHLICSGMEIGTAIPMIREAVVRQLHVMVVDPNVHGEANGFVTFQKTMDYYSARMLVKNKENGKENDGGGGGDDDDKRSNAIPPMYMLSHSASGGHFARYLLDASSQQFLSHLAAVAFTDSTHNIQWAAQKEEQYLQELYRFLESPVCVYFRCAHVRRNGLMSSKDWYMHPAGAPAHTDQYWTHRFGNIKTLWAGTNEHSLTNWYAHTKIWEHFDEFLEDGGAKGTTLAS